MAEVSHVAKIDHDVLSLSYLKHAPGGAIWVGLSLDPEGRKRLLVRVSSFALKKREKYEIAFHQKIEIAFKFT